MANRSNANGVTRFTLVGRVVTWNSTRKTIITRFTFEAQLCALMSCGRKLIGYMDLC